MIKRILSIVLFVLLCLSFSVPLSLAQDEIPTIAILRFGNHMGPMANRTELGILHSLQGMDFVSDDAVAALQQRQDLMGENINIIWGDAGFDFNNAAQMVENALDASADILVTISTPVTQLALNATLDMDDPPIIIFTAVFNPREAGIIESACIKPTHVAGFEAQSPYEDILRIMLMQAPDVEVIGTIFNPAETSGVAGAEDIVAVGESFGLRVEQASVTGMADLRTAAQGLINKGAQLIVLPSDLTTMGGFPAILAVANDNGIPIFHANINAIEVGATLTAGFDQFYAQGLFTGLLLTEYLGGDLDIATTAVHADGAIGLGLNMDSAAELGVEFNDDVLAAAGRTVQDGSLSVEMGERRMELLLSLGASEEEKARAEMLQMLVKIAAPVEESVLSQEAVSQPIVQILRSPAGALLTARGRATLECSPERIAAEQAELDAMEG